MFLNNKKKFDENDMNLIFTLAHAECNFVSPLLFRLYKFLLTCFIDSFKALTEFF